MNRTRITMLLATTLLVAQIAAAQMMGGSGNNHGSTPPNASGNPAGGMNLGIGDGMGQALTVGSDGVVYTLRTSTTTTSTQFPSHFCTASQLKSSRSVRAARSPGPRSSTAA